VGALQLLPDGQGPEGLKTISGTPLDEAALERELQVAGGLRLPFLQDTEDFRLSIAGAQEKSAFLWKEGQWHRPVGATPSTHIFKLPLGTIGGRSDVWQGSLENEWLCSQILAAYGLPVARSSLAQFGSQRALVVERFDRRLASDRAWWLRLPVEDFCQALGLSTQQKYESDGGPGMKEILRILEGSENRTVDRENFFVTQILFWLLAAPDGHAKNFSLFLGPGSTYSSTPLYDVLSAYPWVGSTVGQIPRQKLKMAMAVRGKNPHDRWDQIHRQHWDAEARRLGLGPAATLFIDRVLGKTPDVLDQVKAALPQGFPDFVSQPILVGLREAAQRLGEMQPS
jgi:serine/threonine-protein kinase HipA